MPRHVSPEDVPEPDDEFARLLSDPDAFVRGGRPEAPARTRDALARHGDQSTSWRHGAPLAATPRPVGRRRRGRGWVAWAVVAVVALASLALGLGWFDGGSPTPTGATPPSGAPAHPPITAETPDPTGPMTTTSPDSTVQGLDAAAPPGTCYVAPKDTDDLAVVECARAHDLELVAHEQASGPDDSFPADAYWNGPVAQRCYDDAKEYIGGEKSQWPTGVDTDFYTPSERGWHTGDRGVFCMVRHTSAATGTVKGAAAQKPATA